MSNSFTNQVPLKIELHERLMSIRLVSTPCRSIWTRRLPVCTLDALGVRLTELTKAQRIPGVPIEGPSSQSTTAQVASTRHVWSTATSAPRRLRILQTAGTAAALHRQRHHRPTARSWSPARLGWTCLPRADVSTGAGAW